MINNQYQGRPRSYLKEGIPYNDRDKSVSSKRAFKADVNKTAVRLFHKALEEFGARDATTLDYKKNGDEKLTRGVVEFWKIGGRDKGIPILGTDVFGEVIVYSNGQVYYRIKAAFGDPMSKSLQRIFSRAGFKLTSEGFEGDYEDPSAITNLVEGSLDISRAAVAFNNLNKIIKKANPSYKDTLAISRGSAEDYYRAKGKLKQEYVLVEILDYDDEIAETVVQSYSVERLGHDSYKVYRKNIPDIKDEMVSWEKRIVFYDIDKNGEPGKKLTESIALLIKRASRD